MKTTPILNAKIGGTNFSGLDLTGYNVKRTRSFMVFIDDSELLERWVAEGVKIHEGQNNKHFTVVNLPDDDSKCWIRTKFRREDFKLIDPLMYPLLDISHISKADLLIHEYHWSVHGMSGVKLYLVNGTFHLNKKTDTSKIIAFFQRRKKAIDNYAKFNV